MVSILAVLSNAKGYKDIARFADGRLPELKEQFGIRWRRVPDYTAIRKVLVRISPQDVEEALRRHTHYLAETQLSGPIRMLCFDGKALNGSFSHVRDQRAALVFQAFAPLEKLVLATEDLTSKDSEMPAFQAMLQSLDLKGVYVTADAMHCQKKLLSSPK